MNYERNNTRQFSKSHEPDLSEQMENVVKEAKKMGSQLYREGQDKMDELQNNLKQHSDKIVAKVHEKPLSSLLIAAGVGFILSRLLNR
ncbi:DUF883 family protein [Legionella fairfieldensis]|uniref:DUF883 family protein n=1 Tax=Legionella fairfieldensis TaxID=45064 RepID=UPI000688AE8F|nr:hypothetical protein [Legionella fairfieldensis]